MGGILDSMASNWAVSSASELAGGRKRNVAGTERIVSVVGGSALAAWGISRRDTTGVVAALLGGALVYRGATGYCDVYGMLGVSTADEADSARNVSVPYGRGIGVDESIVIRRRPADVYAFWRRLENLERVVSPVKSVDATGGGRSKWTLHGPAGSTLQWEALVVNEVANELIGWRSLPGATVDHAGSIHFAEVPEGTYVRVELRYDPPAGAAGAAFAKLLGDDPAKLIRESLEEVRTILEEEKPIEG